MEAAPVQYDPDILELTTRAVIARIRSNPGVPIATLIAEARAAMPGVPATPAADRRA